MRSIRNIPVMLAGYIIIFLIVLGTGGNLPFQSKPAPPSSPKDNYTYETWEVEMLLEETPDGRVDAHITETITPIFPEYDQNRGIVRQLPDSYRGSSMRTENITVTNIEGEDYPFFLGTEKPNPTINVGTSEYLHGKQQFIISYTLNDVVSEEGEIYWNMIDEHHAQPIMSFSSTITLAGDLKDRLTGEYKCYIGKPGSTKECSSSLNEQTGTLTQTPTKLNPKEVITLAAGINIDGLNMPADRHSEPQTTFIKDSNISKVALILPTLGMFTIIIAGIIGDIVRRRNSAKKGTIIAEYSTNLSPYEIAAIEDDPKATARTPEAAILQLAVNKTILIKNNPPVTTSAKHPNIELILNDPKYAKNLPTLDKELLPLLYGKLADPTSLTDGISKNQPTIKIATEREFSRTLEAQNIKAENRIIETGLAEKISVKPAKWLGGAGLTMIAVSVIASLTNFQPGNPATGSAMIIAIISLFATAYYLMHLGSTIFGKRTKLTEEGEQAHRHILGLKHFIEIAEKDRIQTLQSYHGTELDNRQIFTLYERLLPYAIMFGQEKTWTEHLNTMAETYFPESTRRESPYMQITKEEYKAITEYAHNPENTNSGSSRSSSDFSSRGSSGGGFSGGGGGGGYSGGR